MNKSRIFYLVVRGGLFILILSLGTLAALVVGETTGLALADLSRASVHAVATVASGDTVYASLTGGPQPSGIYRSDDNGRTWQVVGPGPGVAASVLAVHPANRSVLYAGTGGGSANTTESLWFSANGGQTWHRFPLGLPVSPEGMIPSVSALAVDPNEPGVLYVGTDGQGVYRFEAARDGYGYELVGGVSLYTAHVNGLVVGPDSRVYALTNDGLFATNGGNWQRLPLPEQAVVSLAVAADDPPRLYAGGASTGLYRSTNGGRTWEHVNHGLGLTPGVSLRVTALAVDGQNPHRVIAAVASRVGSLFAQPSIYESQDAGDSWTKLADTSGMVTQLTVKRGVIYAATANGLARYGEPIAPALLTSRINLQSLANLSGSQMLILLLTATLAGLVLAGPTGGRRQGHTTA